MTPREYLTSQEWLDYYETPEAQYYKINAQQLAKNPVLLDCLRAPNGSKFVQVDVTALEPNVLAEFSGDPCYHEIYASGKPHDAYFFVACKLLDKDGSMAAVYNPDNPTKDTVAAAKKQFKKERSVAKVFQLMSTYKAGAAAIHRKLKLNGVHYTKDEVTEIRKRYWGPELFGAILEYENGLLEEVMQRDGWMFNGTGRPLVVLSKKEKDVVNMHCQSTGHDITDLMILFIEQKIKDRGIDARPVVEDYHDETIWMCPEEATDELAQVMREAIDQLNDVIGFSIKIKGDPEVTDNFTGFKEPDPVEWYG